MKNSVLGLIIAILFLSCENKTVEPLRVGTLLWPTHDFFHLADHLGYYKDKNIQLIDYRTPSEVIRAYETGLLDAILVTDHLFLKTNDRLLKDRVLMVLDYSSGSDVLMANPAIKNMENLRGKKIGSESSALGIFVMLRFLELYGLSGNDITHVPVDVAQHTQAYENELFDAVVTYEPFASEMKKQGAVELCNSKEIPFEISDILISSPTIITQKREQLEVLCKGFFDALDVYKKDSSKYISKLSTRENISPEEFSKALKGITVLDLEDNVNLIKNTKAGYFKTLSNVNKKMIDYKLISTEHNITELIDASIIQNINAKN
jgi:NitT/TauT family transport system substrate-binding protein